MTVEKISEARVFGGLHQQFTHNSATLNCEMRFAIFMPDNPKGQALPVLYWLSGLTCTDENFMQKAGAFRVAAELGVVIVAPDTSPRGEDVANDEGYDMGQGAGFYLNATRAPWSSHYHMYDYVVSELPNLIEANFPVSDVRSISGHSMGGHGAITIGLKNAERYRAISAFSPITNPMDCPWGQKAFSGYLGLDQSTWVEYDSCELLKQAKSPLPILVDQGDADSFLEEQLKPQRLAKAAATHGSDLELRIQEGYDHSYFFISTFIEDHIRFHSKHLTA